MIKLDNKSWYLRPGSLGVSMDHISLDVFHQHKDFLSVELNIFVNTKRILQKDFESYMEIEIL